MADTPQPHPNIYNTAKQVRRDTDTISNFVIKLYDVDFAIIEYMNEVIAPSVNEVTGTGPKVKVPIIYGSAERWTSAKRYGYVRDQKGQIQLPLIMIRRNSVARNDQFRTLNRFIRSATVKTYSPKNKYDVFSAMQGAVPTKETYNVVFPDHVTLVYECIVWTSFTEHLNDIIEKFTFADDSYWGHKNKYKFKASIDNIDISNEVSSTEERMIRASFNVNVQAFLLPEDFANKINTIKSYTPKRIIMMTELDTSTLAINPADYGQGYKKVQMGKSKQPAVSMLTEYQRIFDFITLSNSFDATYVSANATTVTVEVDNVAIVQPPSQLSTLITESDRFQVFVNGVLAANTTYSVTTVGNGINIIFVTATLGYTVESDDDVSIRGKLVSR